MLLGAVYSSWLSRPFYRVRLRDCHLVHAWTRLSRRSRVLILAAEAVRRAPGTTRLQSFDPPSRWGYTRPRCSGHRRVVIAVAVIALPQGPLDRMAGAIAVLMGCGVSHLPAGREGFQYLLPLAARSGPRPCGRTVRPVPFWAVRASLGHPRCCQPRSASMALFRAHNLVRIQVSVSAVPGRIRGVPARGEAGPGGFATTCRKGRRDAIARRWRHHQYTPLPAYSVVSTNRCSESVLRPISNPASQSVRRISTLLGSSPRQDDPLSERCRIHPALPRRGVHREDQQKNASGEPAWCRWSSSTRCVRDARATGRHDGRLPAHGVRDFPRGQRRGARDGDRDAARAHRGPHAGEPLVRQLLRYVSRCRGHPRRGVHAPGSGFARGRVHRAFHLATTTSPRGPVQNCQFRAPVTGARDGFVKARRRGGDGGWQG